VVAGVVGLGWAWLDHRHRMLANGPLGRVSAAALYLDNIYNGLIAAPSRGIARGLDVVDRGVDAGLSGVARNAGAPGALFARMQSGYVRAYALSMVLGTALIIGYWALKMIGRGGT